MSILLVQVPSQEGRKNPNKVVKEVDEEEEENKMREEAGLTRYTGTRNINIQGLTKYARTHKVQRTYQIWRHLGT